MSRRAGAGILVCGLLLGYLFSGWVVVAPGEVAVVRRLGRVVQPPWGPGLHLGAPLGLDRVDRVRLGEVRRQLVGLASTPGASDEPGAGEFLTGDLNLVKIEAVVQYRVGDPVRFVLAAEHRERLVRLMAQAALSRALARQGIDRVLGEGRSDLARDAARALDASVEHYGLGITILGVSLTDSRPPAEVAEDFAAAQSARSDRDRRIKEAGAYRVRVETEAKAAGQARLEQAKGRADDVVALAQGRAARFVTLLTETNESRALTIRRLYLESVRDLWRRAGRKLVLTPDEPLDLTLFGSR